MTLHNKPFKPEQSFTPSLLNTSRLMIDFSTKLQGSLRAAGWRFIYVVNAAADTREKTDNTSVYRTGWGKMCQQAIFIYQTVHTRHMNIYCMGCYGKPPQCLIEFSNHGRQKEFNVKANLSRCKKMYHAWWIANVLNHVNLELKIRHEWINGAFSHNDRCEEKRVKSYDSKFTQTRRFY